MQEFIKTPRLILREIVESDFTDLYELDSDPEVHRFLGNNPVQNIKQSKEIIKRIHQQYKDFGLGRWAIIDRFTHEFIGWSGLKFETMPINNQTGYYDLGYRLKRKYWGKGIATEAALESLKYGFTVLNLEKICAAAQIENIPSNKILKKVGLKYTETFEFEGEKCNWYEIEKSDWQEKKLNS